MTRKPAFWIILVILSIVSVLFTFRFFPRAFPLVNLSISMNRRQALSEAERLARENDWGPEEFEQAASFSSDSRVQNFVELEAGGVEKFNELIKGDLYSPFTWIVRHFKENEKNEITIRFTPDGKFYGFTELLPENEPGAALSADSAQVIAEAGADAWNIDLSPYELIETSEEKQIGGRVDFRFIYERADEKLGEGFYRLELSVAGDRLSALRHFVKVPEAFQRRYQEMRSANETISMVALFAVAVLYGIIGIGIGLFFQLKERWIKWRTALFWGCFIALLQVLVMMNQWPLVWMGYDTALSYSSFWMQQVLQLITVFFAEAVLLTLTFMAAEGLTRKAFPNQTQLWKIWKSETAGSKPVVGYTIGGYLGITLFFAFDIALYFLANKLLGWWTPSSSLFEPDVLATYQPWLSSIAISLHAGFWEECLFRAVPIAGAVLLGRKFGGVKWWVAAAFLIQAVIFGAGHANYPMQPAYARIVELILPSIGFGLIFIYFGLLPSIILHFAYDVVWFALPLFVSSTPNIWIQQALVIVFTLVPLWIILWARAKRKSFADTVPEEMKNSAFEPPPSKPKTVEEPELEITTGSKQVNVLFAIIGVLGILIWIGFTTFENLAPPLNLNRGEAETLADEELEQRAIDLSPDWKTLSRVEAPLNQNDRFIWQEESDSVYQSLMGSYLVPPYWLVRYATFEGDVVERAEEYSVKVMGKEDLSYIHTLPEKAPGDSLSEKAARVIAENALVSTFNVNETQLKRVSVTPSKRENRMDWEFVWADTADHPLQSGECRLVVKLAGSEVVDTYQTVHVPEEWSRTEREKNNLINILDIVFGAIPFLLLAVAFVFAIIYWSRKQFDVGIFLKIGIILAVLSLFSVFNSWPAATSMFMTAAPWQHQMLLAIIFSILGALILGAAIGMINGFLKAIAVQPGADKAVVKFVAVLGAGIFIVAALTFIQSFAPSLEPPWADYDALGARLPILSLAFGFVSRFFVRGTIYLLIFVIADRYTKHWTRNKVLAVIFILLLGFGLTDVKGAGTLLFWVLSSLTHGVLLWSVFVLVLRHRLSLAPWLYAPVLIFDGIKEFSFVAFPGSQVGIAIGVILLIVVAFLWERWLGTNSGTANST